jgi:hypothetical protein
VKRLIAYFFLMIFSMQVIPVKEIGKILFNQLITEEEVHNIGTGNTEDGNSVKLKKDGDPFHHNESSQAVARINFLTHQLDIALHQAEKLPVNHVPDIVTPPPNC